LLLLGHRGSRCATAPPENSIPAFDLALQHGADGFEFDVRRTADRLAVLCHDPQFHGLTIAQADRTHLGELTLLEEVLARYRDKAFLDIELKVEGLESSTLAALRQHPPRMGYVVSSFLPEVVHEVHRLDRNLPLGFICDQQETLRLGHGLPLSHLIPHHHLITKDLVEQIHSRGQKIFAWTVNTSEKMRRLARWGVDAIISDDTELLVRTCQDMLSP
jgi:glycerophosphoryl diester phosphodiesterase